jgi:hypothetical protein
MEWCVMALDYLPNILWENAIGFTMLASGFVGFLGASTGSLTIGFSAGYAMFAFIAINAEITLLSDMLLVTVVVFALGFAFKLWKTEGIES